MQYDPDIDRVKAGEVNRPDVDYLNTNFAVLDRVAVRISTDESWFDCLTFQYKNNRGDATLAELESLNLFLPHLTEALVLARSFAQIKKKFGAVFAMLDRVSNGMVLVTEQAQVVLANHAANEILESGQGIAVSRNGRLLVSDSDMHRQLLKAISQASKTAKACGNSANTLISVCGEKNNDPYLIEISPLLDHDDEMECYFRGALVTIIDPYCVRPVDISGMEHIYGLSEAEADVTRLLIEGHTYRELADVRGVTIETIKSQTKSIFQKTNSSNRTELIRRALRIALPIDFD